MGLNHKELCDIAVKWLKRPNSQNGHGCGVAVSEVATATEIPDAIGFRSIGSYTDGSVLIEVKVSRSDFLADKKKPHRATGGMGDWRYYMTPKGLIQVEELPPKWGLIEVNERGHCKVVVGATANAKRYGQFVTDLELFKHDDVNRMAEYFILVKLLGRVDAEQENKNFKKVYAENDKLRQKIAYLQDQQRKIELERDRLWWRLNESVENEIK